MLRLALESDLLHLEAICDACGPAAHWTRQQWLAVFREQSPARVAWVAEIDGQDIGFLVAQTSAPDWELENIAVLPDFRRRGIAAELLSALVIHARAHVAERILLEVRASNLPAIHLYQSSNFEVAGYRRGYYHNPPEDALIMVQTL